MTNIKIELRLRIYVPTLSPRRDSAFSLITRVTRITKRSRTALSVASINSCSGAVSVTGVLTVAKLKSEDLNLEFSQGKALGA